VGGVRIWGWEGLGEALRAGTGVMIVSGVVADSYACQ
jgi:hypothetical protein